MDDALAKGAVDVTPVNESFQLAGTAKTGNFFAPIVLTNVDHSMVTMREETFGPVLPIMSVSSDDEAIALMNNSDYGLTASVWTKDVVRGEALIADLEAGTVFVNRCDYPSPVCFSFQSTGTGIDGILGSGVDGLEEFRAWVYAWAESVRWGCQVEELPCQREGVDRTAPSLIHCLMHLRLFS